jgi:hypothetical protein
MSDLPDDGSPLDDGLMPDEVPTSPELPTYKCPACKGEPYSRCELCLGERFVNRHVLAKWVSDGLSDGVKGHP